MTPVAAARLEILGGSKAYGGVRALDDVTLRFPIDTITGIVGPNGAGKTTLLNVLSGHSAATEGRVLLDGVDVTRSPAHRRARRGLSRTFQNLELSPDMSIGDTVMTGAYTRVRRRDPGMGTLWSRNTLLRERAREALRDCGVDIDADRRPGELSYGQQKIVELARVMLANASMVLLDEPFAGLSVDDRLRVSEVIRSLRRDGATVAIIDHDVQTIFDLVDSVAVLNLGRLVAQGSPEEVRTDRRVIEAYLGVDE